MEKEFVPYDRALKLKALGFDEPCLAYYEGNELTHGMLNDIGKKRYLQTPTFSQAFRWFREKYGLFIQPNRTIDSEGIWYYFSIASKRTDVCEGSFVYEEAEIACLEKLIEIVEAKSTQNANDGRAMEKLIESNRKFDEKNNNDVKYNPNDRNEDTPNITNFFI